MCSLNFDFEKIYPFIFSTGKVHVLHYVIMLLFMDFSDDRKVLNEVLNIPVPETIQNSHLETVTGAVLY